MTQRKILAGLMLSLGALLGGCQVNETASYDPAASENQTFEIVSRSSTLWADLKIEDFRTAHAGDLLRAQVVLRNEDDDPEVFKYKFKWFDAAGFEVAIDNRPWTPIVIQGYEAATIQAVAPNASVESFRVIVLN